jgi:hypothetical protein
MRDRLLEMRPMRGKLLKSQPMRDRKDPEKGIREANNHYSQRRMGANNEMTDIYISN